MTDWKRFFPTSDPGGGICHFVGHAGPGVTAVMIRLPDGTEALAPAAGGIWWTVAWLDEHDQWTAEGASWRAVATDGDALASGTGLEDAADEDLVPPAETVDVRSDTVQGVVLRELSAHEHLLQRRGLDTTRDDLEDLLGPTFVEVDPSGRRRGRRYALDARWNRSVDERRGDWRPTDVECVLAGQDTYLLTYEVLEGRRRTRRATLWQRGPRRWQALHHQATPVL